MRFTHQFPIAALLLVLVALAGPAVWVRQAASQAGRRPSDSPSSSRHVLLNVTAMRTDGSEEPINAREIAVFDGSMEQKVQTFSLDQGPARIVLLIDNSLSLRADVEKLTKATREFAYEIYEGDQVLVVGYDEQAEIIADWTDDAKKIEAALPSFRKKGEPHLFDAISAVLEQGLRQFGAANRKRVIVLISDGLDRGSKTKFDDALAQVQAQDITLYALQIPDRTGGAYRRDRPKPSQVIEKLVEGTGGQILSIDEPGAAAKSICDELRKNRYVLAYTPTFHALTEARRLLVLGSDDIKIRTKTMIK